jgi:hypothetical protein
VQSNCHLCLHLLLLLLNWFFRLLHLHLFLLLLLLRLFLLLLLWLLLFGQEGHLGYWILDKEPAGLGQIALDLWQVLDVFVPTEEIVVLEFLLITEVDKVVVELREHVEVSEGNVVAHKESPVLEILL